MVVTKTGNDHKPRQTNTNDHNSPANDFKPPVKDHKLPVNTTNHWQTNTNFQ